MSADGHANAGTKLEISADKSGTQVHLNGEEGMGNDGPDVNVLNANVGKLLSVCSELAQDL